MWIGFLWSMKCVLVYYIGKLNKDWKSLITPKTQGNADHNFLQRVLLGWVCIYIIKEQPW